MGRAHAVFHGSFGRASLYRLNKPLAPHAHREGHLIFLISGAPATITLGRTSYRAHACEAVAISPWQPHDFYPGDLGEGAVFLTLYITPRWFIEMSKDIGDVMSFGAPLIALCPTIRDLVDRLAERLAEGTMGPSFTDVLHELTVACFEESWAVPRAGAKASVWPRASDYRIRNALRLMNERVTDACVLDRIARDAGLSRPHFYKLFRQNVGLTPNMYLNTLRLERSIDRLTTSADPVTSIGLDLGFASQASFTRFFCNNVGIAPTDYRRVSQRN